MFAPEVSFVDSVKTVNEAVGLVSLQLSRSGDTTQAASVDVVLGVSSADIGQDFTLGNQFTGQTASIDFPANMATASIDLSIIDDALSEPQEDIVFELKNPSTNISLGQNANAKINITDNDSVGTSPGVLSIKISASLNVDESAGKVSIEIIRSGGSVGDVTAEILLNGTSDPVLDYDFSSTTVVLADGQLKTTFDITIIDDPNAEPDETLIISLSLPKEDVQIGNQSNITLTITDNDGNSTKSGKGYLLI